MGSERSLSEDLNHTQKLEAAAGPPERLQELTWEHSHQGQGTAGLSNRYASSVGMSVASEETLNRNVMRRVA
jgi:hypothetical protein